MNRLGISIMELLIAAALVSVIFLGATVMYVSSLSAFRHMDEKEQEINIFLAMEYLCRRIGLGNQVELKPDGSQIKVRWDYADYQTPLGSPANGTPSDFSDDTFLKYRFINNALRFRIDSTLAGDVLSSDPEVVEGLFFVGTSNFKLLDPNHVAIDLVAEIGDPARQKQIRSAVILQGRAQNG